MWQLSITRHFARTSVIIMLLCLVPVVIMFMWALLNLIVGAILFPAIALAISMVFRARRMFEYVMHALVPPFVR